MELLNLTINAGMFVCAFIAVVPVIGHGAVIHARRKRIRGQHHLSRIHRILLAIAKFYGVE